jgi:4-amino-4-deoxy-L-arabinose transferase-like glycosyltransferase
VDGAGEERGYDGAVAGVIDVDARTTDASSDQRTVPPDEPSTRIVVITLAIITAIATILRAKYLNGPMRWDETFSFVNYSSKPLARGLESYTPNNHLLNTVLVHLSYGVFGEHRWALRLPAFLAGVTLVPATGWMIARFYGARAGLIAAGVVAGSSFLTEFSANARGYSLVALCAVLCAGIAAKILERPSVPGALAFGVAGGVGLATIPVMILPLGGIAAWLGLSALARARRDRWALLGATALGTLAALAAAIPIYFPAAFRHGAGSILDNKWIAPMSFARWRAAMPHRLAETWEFWTRDLTIVVSFLLLAGFAVAMIGHKGVTSRQRWMPPIPLPLAVVVWCAAFVLGRRVVPYSAVWLILLPLFLGVGAAGLTWLAGRIRPRLPWREIAPVAAVAVAAALALATVTSHGVERSRQTGKYAAAEPITLLLKPRLVRGDRLIALSAAQALLEYYFRIHHVPARYLHASLSERGTIYVAVDPENGRTVNDFLPLIERNNIEVGPPRLVARYADGELYAFSPR